MLAHSDRPRCDRKTGFCRHGHGDITSTMTGMSAGISPSLGGQRTARIYCPDCYAGPSAIALPHVGSSVRSAIEDPRSRRPRLLDLRTIFFAAMEWCAIPPASARSGASRANDAGRPGLADECASGFARTGEAMWAFQRHGSCRIVTIASMGQRFSLCGRGQCGRRSCRIRRPAVISTR